MLFSALFVAFVVLFVLPIVFALCLDRVGGRVSSGVPWVTRLERQMLWMRARIAKFTLVENSVVNIYVDLRSMVLSVLFLVSPKLRLFSNLVVLSNSCFASNLVTVRYRSLVAVQSRNPDIGGKNDDRLA